MGLGCVVVVTSLSIGRLAEARADLKHTVLSEWIVLLSMWFQAMVVFAKKE